MGVIRTDPIAVTLQDELGNKLNVKQSQLPLIRVNAEGLDESLIEKVIEVTRDEVAGDFQYIKFVLMPSGWLRAVE